MASLRLRNVPDAERRTLTAAGGMRHRPPGGFSGYASTAFRARSRRRFAQLTMRVASAAETNVKPY